MYVICVCTYININMNAHGSWYFGNVSSGSGHVALCIGNVELSGVLAKQKIPSR